MVLSYLGQVQAIYNLIQQPSKEYLEFILTKVNWLYNPQHHWLPCAKCLYYGSTSTGWKCINHINLSPSNNLTFFGSIESQYCPDLDPEVHRFIKTIFWCQDQPDIPPLLCDDCEMVTDDICPCPCDKLRQHKESLKQQQLSMIPNPKPKPQPFLKNKNNTIPKAPKAKRIKKDINYDELNDLVLDLNDYF